MLPRLDFHSSLRDAVLDGRKTATTRLVGELDSNSDIDGLRPGMRAAATCQGETFAELTILSIEPVSYDAIDDKLARAEDCADAAELKSLLKSFYPRAKPTTAFLAIRFRCAANANTITFVDAAAASLKVLGLVGDFCSPLLAREYPLAALSLNANDAHCLLTHHFPLLPWLLVVVLTTDSGGQRLLRSRQAAGPALRRRVAPLGAHVEGGGPGGRRAAPGVSTCALAGAAGVSWSMFGGVTLVGALLRALAIRAVAEQIPGLRDLSWCLRLQIAGAAAALPLIIASLRVDRAQRGDMCWATSPGPGRGRAATGCRTTRSP